MLVSVQLALKPRFYRGFFLARSPISPYLINIRLELDFGGPGIAALRYTAMEAGAIDTRGSLFARLAEPIHP